MTDLRKAAEMALETLERLDGWLALRYGNELTPPEREVVKALRQALSQPDSSCNGMPAYEGSLSKSQALAQPEQEPVAWFSILPDNSLSIKISGKPTTGNWEPLYTAPSKREWVGLTPDEISELSEQAKKFCNDMFNTPDYDYFAGALWRAIEAKLKEKNT